MSEHPIVHAKMPKEYFRLRKLSCNKIRLCIAFCNELYYVINYSKTFYMVRRLSPKAKNLVTKFGYLWHFVTHYTML